MGGKITAAAAALYKAVLHLIRQKAQKNQFGAEFPHNINIVKQIDADYHHILDSHIKYGKKGTVEGVFAFFGKVVHYEDVDSKVDKCRSVNRKKQRDETLGSDSNIIKSKNVKSDIIDTKKDKNIWSSKQYYLQSELDKIHTFLVHSNGESFINRYVNKIDDEKMDAADINPSMVAN
eukprot:31039_1